MNYVYHGSSIPNLEVIKKHKSTHMKEWVYACHSKGIATIFLSKQGSDLFYSLSGDGKKYPVELVERKPGMFKKNLIVLDIFINQMHLILEKTKLDGPQKQ